MSILNDAAALIGKVTYDFGANDIENGRGDCSSFTQYVFKKNGYNIGRNCTAQLQNGEPVEYKDLKPGDLVFFQGTYKEGVSHVGIYVGNHKMVNLQNDGVKIDPINKGYWKEHYMTARRVAEARDVGILPLEIAVEETEGGAFDVEETLNPFSSTNWLGDILVVVLIIAACLLGVFFIFKALSVNLPSLDDIGNAIEKVKPKGEN